MTIGSDASQRTFDYEKNVIDQYQDHLIKVVKSLYTVRAYSLQIL